MGPRDSQGRLLEHVCNHCHAFIPTADEGQPAVPRFLCVECKSYDLCAECWRGLQAGAVSHLHDPELFVCQRRSDARTRHLVQRPSNASVAATLACAFEQYGDLPLVGIPRARALPGRVWTPREDGLAPEACIQWQTYREVGESAFATGEGLLAVLQGASLGAAPVAVLWLENCLEHVHATFGCFLKGIVAVPIPATSPCASLAAVAGSTRATLLVCSRHTLEKLCSWPHLTASDAPPFLHVVVVDPALPGASGDGDKAAAAGHASRGNWEYYGYGSGSEAPSWRRTSTRDHCAEAQAVLQAAGWAAVCRPYDEVVRSGRARLHASGPRIVPAAADDPITIYHTSGSTGPPKGAVMTDALLRASLHRSQGSLRPLVMFCTVSLAYRSGLNKLIACIPTGGRMGLHAGNNRDPDVLLSEMSVVRPTVLSTVPALWVQFHQSYRRDVARMTSQRLGASCADADAGQGRGPATLARSRSLPLASGASVGGEVDHTALRTAAEGEISDWYHDAVFGGRLGMIGYGGASLGRPDVLAWMDRCLFDAMVQDGYGATEVGTIARAGQFHPAVEIRLLDVDGFTSNDLPYPRGELLVRAWDEEHPRQIPGYWRDQSGGGNGGGDSAAYDLRGRFVQDPLAPKRPRVAQASTPGADSPLSAGSLFFRTGDIVEVRPQRSLEPPAIASADSRPPVTEKEYPFVRIIGRSGVCFKMSNGVFVSPELLEAQLVQHSGDLLAQLYVHHESSSASSLVAVGVPTAAAQSLPDEELERRVLDGFSSAAAACDGVTVVPAAVLLSREAFTVENGLMTGSNKMNRSALRRRFGAQLAALAGGASAAGGEENDKGWTRARGISSRPENQDDFVPWACRVIGEVIGGSTSAAVREAASVNLLAVCGNSLAIARLAGELGRSHAQRVPLEVFYRARTLGAVADYMRGEMPPPDNGGSDDALQGDTLPSAGALLRQKLGRLASVDAPGAAGKHGGTPASPLPGTTVLVTGADGFVGRMLVRQLAAASQASGEPLTVLCMVRRPADPRRDREQWGDDAGRVTVRCLQGDLTAPYFGWPADRFCRLAGRVDVVFHSGAWVNHELPVRRLWPTNVGGTAEVVHLALLGPKKTRLVFMSTQSAARGTDAHRGERAYGYCRTKYLAELVVNEAVNTCGLDAAVVRLPLCGPHSVTGECNTRDFVTRRLLREGTDAVCGKGLTFVPVDKLAAALVAEPPGLPPREATVQVDTAEALRPMMQWLESRPPSERAAWNV